MNLVQALYLNNDVEPFDDVRVRQALSYAVDKQQIMDLALDGYGTAIGSSMYPAFGKYFDGALTDYYTLDTGKGQGAADRGRLSRRLLHDHHRAQQLPAPHGHRPGVGGAAEGHRRQRHHPAGGVGQLGPDVYTGRQFRPRWWAWMLPT